MEMTRASTGDLLRRCDDAILERETQVGARGGAVGDSGCKGRGLSVIVGARGGGCRCLWVQGEGAVGAG
jgi:hypothetical protein